MNKKTKYIVIENTTILYLSSLFIIYQHVLTHHN